ncbi:hypothetical protein EVAR_11344_1 [Eumeta japonica]|uniref:Uncharacterized protein n=1 Tax=Eumeta variegata TaxID=151549 RepID=A0A4C1U1M4_EUMVA|nr:hypothetical protein EVAR_11344_1 [Eumeta japonica]
MHQSHQFPHKLINFYAFSVYTKGFALCSESKTVPKKQTIVTRIHYISYERHDSRLVERNASTSSSNRERRSSPRTCKPSAQTYLSRRDRGTERRREERITTERADRAPYRSIYGLCK